MKQFKEVTPELMRKNPFELIGKDWMLVTAGNDEKVNTMTASWGGLGVMWGKNVAFIVIRPQRYTKEFIDREDTFSLSFFDKDFRKELNYLGSTSGRDEDKINNAGLTVVNTDQTPYFDEANLVFICKKLFQQPFEENSFLDENFSSTFYPNKDFHTLYIAEITKIIQSVE